MPKALRKTFLAGLRTTLIFLFVATWMYTALPSLFSFPPKVEKAEAAVNFVQGNTNVNSGSVSAGFLANTKAGNMIIVAVAWTDNVTSPSPPLDSQGIVCECSWTNQNRKH